MIVRIIAGAPTAYIEKTDGFIIAVDKGVRHCLEQNISFDLAIGDFDSFPVEEVTSKKLVLNPVKDETDLFVAIQKAIEMKPEKIVIYGGSNGRADHYLANINLLGMYNIELVDEENRIFVKGDKFSVSTDDYISFFHFDGEPIITLEGFKYPLNKYYLNPRDNLCVSNEVIEEGIVSISGGRILVIISKEKATG